MSSLFGRFFRTAGPRCARRFILSMEMFLDGIVREAEYRESGGNYDAEDYLALRKDTSGLRPCFVLCEFAAGLDLPDEVMEDARIKALEDAANDWVAWTNVSG